MFRHRLRLYDAAPCQSIRRFYLANSGYRLTPAEAREQCGICTYPLTPRNRRRGRGRGRMVRDDAAWPVGYSHRHQEEDTTIQDRRAMKLEECGHIAHFRCLVKWSDTCSTCPFCRTEMFFHLVDAVCDECDGPIAADVEGEGWADDARIAHLRWNTNDYGAVPLVEEYSDEDYSPAGYSLDDEWETELALEFSREEAQGRSNGQVAQADTRRVPIGPNLFRVTQSGAHRAAGEYFASNISQPDVRRAPTSHFSANLPQPNMPRATDGHGVSSSLYQPPIDLTSLLSRWEPPTNTSPPQPEPAPDFDVEMIDVDWDFDYADEWL